MSIGDPQARRHPVIVGGLHGHSSTVLDVEIASLHNGSPAACDGAISMPPGDGAHASLGASSSGRSPALGGGACVTYPPRPVGLLPAPPPPGVGLCLACMWADARDDKAAAERHTRRTGHPTIFRSRAPEPDGEGDQ